MRLNTLPFPPAPEPGWYEDDLPATGNIMQRPGPADARQNSEPYILKQSKSIVLKGNKTEDISPENHEDPESGDAIEDWDGTVLASSFTIRQPRRTYLLHNNATGQSITIDRSALLGRKPSETIPEGAKAVTVEDPTHTISRNHAAISVDTDGQLWIEDYGSLNGTFIIRDGKESQVAGAPAKLDTPVMLRFADQFLELTVQQD